MKVKKEFGKKLLIADYTVLLVMLLMFFVPGIDTLNWAIIVVAWIAQVGISTNAYYKKAKAENLVKLPIYMLKEIPADMKEKADPNQIIASIISLGHNN